MIFIVAAILLILWLIGLFTTYTFNGYIHILIVVAVIMVIVGLLQRRGVL